MSLKEYKNCHIRIMLRRMLSMRITSFETIIFGLRSKIAELEERIKRLEKINDSLQPSEQSLSNIPLCDSLDCVDDFHKLMEFDLLEPKV